MTSDFLIIVSITAQKQNVPLFYSRAMVLSYRNQPTDFQSRSNDSQSKTVKTLVVNELKIYLVNSISADNYKESNFL